MSVRVSILRSSVLAVCGLLMACQSGSLPVVPSPATPPPEPVGTAERPSLYLEVQASDRLRGRTITSLRVEVDGVRAEQQSDGRWGVKVAAAETHSVRLVRPGYLPLTYKGPLPKGAKLEARLSPSGVRVVGFGDSLTAGLKVDLGDRFVMKLVGRIQAARPGFWVDFVDQGKSGDTYSKAIQRLTDDVLNQNPDVTLVEFGTNDVFNTTLSRFPEALDDLLQPLSRVSPGVIVADIPYKPRWDGDWNEVSAPYNREIAAAAERHGAHLVSFATIFRRAAEGGVWDLFYHEAPYDPSLPDSVSQGDLHPNAAGNELMAEAFAEAILALTEPEVRLAKS